MLLRSAPMRSSTVTRAHRVTILCHCFALWLPCWIKSAVGGYHFTTNNIATNATDSWIPFEVRSVLPHRSMSPFERSRDKLPQVEIGASAFGRLSRWIFGWMLNPSDLSAMKLVCNS